MSSDLLDRVPPAADHRLHYGPGELQFGDLRLPKLASGQRAPLVMFIHGGWWKAEYGLEYGGHLCAALSKDGIATWSIEYARVGNGGGFPQTFADVAAGYDFLTTLARSYPIDLDRVVTSGHSAGGHLAFWLAGRHHIAETSALHGSGPAIPMRGLVALAGAVDLRLTIDLAGPFTFAHDKDEVFRLMGGTPAQVPERYAAGNPGDLLPLNIPQVLLQGTHDDQIPSQLPVRWAQMATRAGDAVKIEMLPGADHFDVVDPTSWAWSHVRASLLKAFG